MRCLDGSPDAHDQAVGVWKIRNRSRVACAGCPLRSTVSMSGRRLAILEACCFVEAAGGVAGAVGVRAGARERAAIDDQVFLADRTTSKPAFQDLAHAGRVAGLREQGG